MKQRFESLVRHMSFVLHTNWWFGMIKDLFLKDEDANCEYEMVSDAEGAMHLIRRGYSKVSSNGSGGVSTHWKRYSSCETGCKEENHRGQIRLVG